MAFHITEVEKNKHYAVAGNIDTTNNIEFEKQFKDMLSDVNSKVYCDCAELDYVSSAGLRALLSINKHVIAQEGSLVIVNLHPNIKEIFDLTGFSKIFIIE